MAKELYELSNGIFSFSETEVENRYIFYRNDGGVIGDVGSIPMDFYHSYIAHKMVSGEITDIVMKRISFETSYDDKFIMLTISEIGKCEQEVESRDSKSVEENKNQPVPAEETPKPNFFKRIFKKIFGE